MPQHGKGIHFDLQHAIGRSEQQPLHIFTPMCVQLVAARRLEHSGHTLASSSVKETQTPPPFSLFRCYVCSDIFLLTLIAESDVLDEGGGS